MNDNDIFKSITTKEVVSDIDVVKAYLILYHAQVITSDDVYLFLASLNLLNTYAKQNKKAIDYSFKSRLYFLNKILAYNDIPDIRISYFYTKKEQLYMFQIKDVQFSFHGIIIEQGVWDLLKKYQAQLSWDGIRKQMCAVTCFNIALEKDNLTQETRNYENLKEFLNNKVNDYKNGLIKIDKKGLVDNTGNFI